MNGRVLHVIVALALVLSIAIPIRTPVMAQGPNTINMTLSGSASANSKGILYYQVRLTNSNIPGAYPAEVDIVFYPPGPTGEEDAYRPEMILDTGRAIAPGQTVVYDIEVDLKLFPLNEGVTTAWARAEYDAEFLADPGYDGDGYRNVYADIIWPDTKVTITSSSPTVSSGGSVTLTVTEQNTGDVDLTNPYVEIWKNGEHLTTLEAPPNSGDVGDPGVLNVGETWTWYHDSGPITSTTTFVALGFGRDPLLNEVSYPDYPDERDEVTVTVTDLEPAQLGGFVWHDLDADGIQDLGEPGIEGVTVRLLDCDTSGVLDTSTTGADGLYLFTDLAPGDYKVEFILPDGYVFSPQHEGTDPALDSDADPVTGRTDCVSVASGETATRLDAGMYQLAQLGGFVWHDENRDGIQDLGEPGIEGVTVRLLDCDTSGVLDTSTTGTDGLYLFTDLTPGDYKVEFTLPDGYVFSPQHEGTDPALDSDADPVTGRTDCVSVASGETATRLDAGMYQPAPIALGGFVWNDENRDGIQDAGEPGIQGVTVNLLDCDTGHLLATNTTDDLGRYLFPDRTPGDYRVQFVLPEGNWAFTLQDADNEGIEGTVNSDADPDTGITECVTLEEDDEDKLFVDAGMYQLAPATLGGFVWEDENRDGIRDPDEPGIGGVTVNLLDCDTSAILATNITVSDGSYLFTNLMPGDYKVQFVLPEDYWAFTMQDADGEGIEGEFNSDAYPGTGITECVTLEEDDFAFFVGVGMYEMDLYRICGFKYTESDSDTVGLPNWEIILLRKVNDVWTTVATNVTIADGSYCFTDLPAGKYRVMEKLKPGWEKIDPVGDYHEVTLPGGEGESYDFHNLYRPPDITVGWEGRSVNKVAVLAPWIALMLGAMAGAVLFFRRRQATG